MSYLTIRDPWSSLAASSFGLFPAWSAFDNVFGKLSSEFEADETEDGFTLSLPVAGYKPSEVNVTIDKGVLTITAENKKRGSLVKAVTLWKEVDAERVDAQVEDGLLTLSLKKQERAKPKRIAIK